MKNPRSISLTAAILFLLTFSGNVAAEGSPASAEYLSKTSGESVSVKFVATPKNRSHKETAILKADEAVTLGFHITDNNSSYGIPELHPAAWIVHREAGTGKPDRHACRSNIRGFLRSGIVQADLIDLNSYRVITLNADSTIGIYNPRINLATSNLLALIKLDGKAGGWVFDETNGRAYVTLPDKDKVAIIDIDAQRLDRYIKTGRRPESIWQAPNGVLYVANSVSGTLSIIDPLGLKLIKTIEVGTGEIAISFDPGRRVLITASSKDGLVSFFDNQRFEKKDSINLEEGRMQIVFSEMSDALYISNSRTGKLTALYTDPIEIKNELDIVPGSSLLKTTRDGRFLLLLNKLESSLIIIDTAYNRIIRRFETLYEPDNLEFSKAFAYIRSQKNGNISILQTSALSEPDPPPFIDVLIGKPFPEETPYLAGVSPIAILPGDGGALIVSPGDKTIYYYMEGMSAPSNSFRSYTSPPIGVFIYDQSLRENFVPGLYETTTRFGEGGIYDVHFYLPSPQVAVCFEMALEGEAEEVATDRVTPEITPLFEEKTFIPQEASKIRFKITDPIKGRPLTGLSDIRIVSFKAGSGWQAREWALSKGNGIYEAKFTFPREGRYHVLVEALSIGVGFEENGHFIALVKDKVKNCELCGGETR